MKSGSRRLLLMAFAILLVFPFWAQSQSKSISLEDVFKNRKFSSRGAPGIRSMKDGIHYTQVKNDTLII